MDTEEMKTPGNKVGLNQNEEQAVLKLLREVPVEKLRIQKLEADSEPAILKAQHKVLHPAQKKVKLPMKIVEVQSPNHFPSMLEKPAPPVQKENSLKQHVPEPPYRSTLDRHQKPTALQRQMSALSSASLAYSHESLQSERKSVFLNAPSMRVKSELQHDRDKHSTNSPELESDRLSADSS